MIYVYVTLYFMFCVSLGIFIPIYNEHIIYSAPIALLLVLTLPFYDDIYNLIKNKMKGK
jgi:hypothetical protein